MNLAQIQVVHEAIAEAHEKASLNDTAGADAAWVEAANLALAADGIDEEVATRQEAVELLQTLERNLAAESRYIEVATLLWGNGMFDSRPSPVRDVFEEVTKNSRLLIMGGSSLSKCLGPDVPVLMFDGSTKKAKDVRVGDVLMGDDNTPRNVLQKDVGHGPLYRIIPERGDPWVCNDAHILSLRVTSPRKCGSGAWSRKWIKGETKDIPLTDYVKLSRTSRSRLKQFHVGVEFADKPLPFDPYIYGAWLGDGCTIFPTLHTPDGPMAKEWMRYWETVPGMRSSINVQKEGKCAVWRASKAKGTYRNRFTDFIRTSVDGEGKFIRKEYLVNSRGNRLKLLAGLLDSDGFLEKRGASYGFVGKSERFVRQVAWLARSLGFAARVWPAKHSIKKIGFTAVYWHTRISGTGVSEIPCLEKPARESTSLKDMCCTSFKVEPIGGGEYHGFLIDGNHRFLLGDFTVTHNTFSCGVLFYIAWRQDPHWTAVKLAAPSETHLYTNLFSHLVALHRAAVIPMTDDDARKVQVNETEMFISMSDALPEMRIQGVLCKQSAISAGALRGHKPKPYRKPLHPVLGNSTRLLILIDEGSQVSPGAFEDIRTTEASIDERIKNVKIVIAFNPERVDQKIVQMAEPPDGWDIEQVDTLYKYISKQGYPVLRLDGKRFENVVERRVIYPRMLTYEAFLDFLKAGEHSGVYWAKGRGFPPLKDNAWTVIPPAWVQSQRGEPVYTGLPKNIAALDTALAGSDKALLGIGRWGEASGWTDQNGKTEWFISRADPSLRITKHVAVLDQIFQLPKTNSTVEIIQEVMGRCKALGIPPENVAMDAGGNAGGVWSHAKKFWGDVLGVDNGTRASESKVLAEDQLTCYDMYHLKATELWFAMKRWLEPTVCALLISPIVPSSPLFMQLTTRRYRNIKGAKVQIEPKHEWRHRNSGQSPDEADILNLLVEWCRERGGVTPGIQETVNGQGAGEGYEGPMSLESADEPDTISTAEWEPNALES